MSLNRLLIEKLGIGQADLAGLLAGDVCEIFSTMVGMPDISHLPNDGPPALHAGENVTAMVGLAGACNGMVYVHTSQPQAISFASNMLGMEVTEVDDDVTDAMGEIANMIGGSFKHHLSHGGDDIKLSTPSVVTGAYTISASHPGHDLTLAFTASGEPFVVTVVLEKD